MSLLELGLSTRSPSKGARVLCTKSNFLSGSGLDLVGLELELELCRVHEVKGCQAIWVHHQIQFLRQPKCAKLFLPSFSSSASTYSNIAQLTLWALIKVFVLIFCATNAMSLCCGDFYPLPNSGPSE